MHRALDVAFSVLVSLIRLGAGAAAGEAGRVPQRRLELYEFEGCPFCRKVREAITALDLEILVLPCPKRGTRFRPQAVELGGKAQFPYLVDPNRGDALYESEDIIDALYARYGPGERSARAPAALRDIGSVLSGLPRLARGSFARPSKPPAQPLELYSFEASPFCRIAREALCELELPYVLKSVGKGSGRRDELEARAGKVQVPYLVDPNTGREMFESADIVRYLHEAYANV